MARPSTTQAFELLDLILERICVALQITPTQFNDAEQKYEAVCRWLSAPGSPIAEFEPYLHPQGSLKIDTTVRPLGQAEFDLDLVCLLRVRRYMDPGAVFAMIWDRLYASGTYRGMIEPKRRCIRINYAGQFHLDVVPAVPDWAQGGSCIFVPDIPKPELKDWKASNPLGYAEWFQKATVRRPRVRKFSALEAKAYHAPLVGPKPVHQKAALRLAVQLFKRWRDIEFADRPGLAPPSILLTTLSGQYYDGEEDYSAALTAILNQIVAAASRHRLVLYNPVNPQELLSEKWRDDPDSYDAFVEAVTEFRDRWMDLALTGGLPDITAELRRLFGEQAAEAVKEAFDPLEKARAEGRLYADRSTANLLPACAAAASAVVKVHGNTFHGD